MQEGGVAILRKFSEAAHHSRSIKVSYVVFWYCVAGCVITILALYIIERVMDVFIERFNVNGTAR